MADNDIQKITQKTKDRTTQTPLNTGVNSGAPEGLADPAPYVTCNLRHNTTKRHDHPLTCRSCWTPVYVNKYK